MNHTKLKVKKKNYCNVEYVIFTKTKSFNKIKIFDQAITSEYEVAVM